MAALVFALTVPTFAGSVWWKDTTGATVGAPLAGTWDNVQAAIVAAQGGGGGGRGEVRIEGDVARAAGDVNVSLDVSAGGNIDVSGGWDAAFTAQTDSVRSTLDSQSNTLATKDRVLKVDAPNVTLDNLWLKNGQNAPGTSVSGAGLYAASNASGLRVSDSIVSDNRNDIGDNTGKPTANGGGVYVEGCNDVKLSRMIIANNRCYGGYQSAGGGRGININNAGTETEPIIVEYCHIADNVGGSSSRGYGSGVAVIGTSQAMIANSRITGGGACTGGSGLYARGEKTTVFGTLIDDSDLTGGVIYAGGPAASPESLVMANCTVADNEAGGSALVKAIGIGGSGDVNSMVLINSLIGVTDPNSTTMAHQVEVRRQSYSQGYRPHMLLQNSTFSADVAPIINTHFDVEGSYSTPSYLVDDLWDALNTKGHWGNYRYHALDPLTGALLPNPQAGANLEENINLVTADDLSGGDPSERLYKFQVGPGDFTSGFSSAVQDGGGFVYVDVDHDGTFDSTLDIVVYGSAPANALHVYLYDLSYLGRVTRSGSTYLIEDGSVLAAGLDPSGLGYASSRYYVGFGMDRGAYQQERPPIGEPTSVGLLLLGVPFLRRRRS